MYNLSFFETEQYKSKSKTIEENRKREIDLLERFVNQHQQRSERKEERRRDRRAG